MDLLYLLNCDEFVWINVIMTRPYVHTLWPGITLSSLLCIYSIASSKRSHNPSFHGSLNRWYIYFYICLCEVLIIIFYTFVFFIYYHFSEKKNWCPSSSCWIHIFFFFFFCFSVFWVAINWQNCMNTYFLLRLCDFMLITSNKMFKNNFYFFFIFFFTFWKSLIMTSLLLWWHHHIKITWLIVSSS